MTGNPQTPPLVLIVEDDYDIRTTLAAILRSEGIDAVEARNGREALELLPQKPFTMVLLDLDMPVMDGWELRRRQRELRPDVATVVMTGTLLSPLDLLALGATLTLRKPFHIGDLLSVIRAPVPAR